MLFLYKEAKIMPVRAINLQRALIIISEKSYVLR